MALFDNLKTVLTPYAEKINDHTVDIHDLNTAVDSLNGSLESVDTEIDSLSGSLEDIRAGLGNVGTEGETRELITLTINTDGCYRTTGVFVSDTNRAYAIVTPVTVGDKYKLSTQLTSALIPAILYFNNDTFLSYEKTGIGTLEIVTDYSFTIPSNCNKIIVQSSSGGTRPSLAKVEDVFIPNFYPKSYIDGIFVKEPAKNLINPNALTRGFLDSSGVITAGADWYTTDYIDVRGISDIFLSVKDGNGRQKYMFFFLCTYDSSKTFIEQVTNQMNPPYTVGSGVSYIRFCYKPSTVAEIQAESGTSYSSYEEYTLYDVMKNSPYLEVSEAVVSDFYNLKWAVFGDSLTAKNAKAATAYYDWIQKQLGCSIVNYGKSGTGYAKESSGSDSFMDRMLNIDPSTFDVLTIFGSFNDLSAGLPVGDATDMGTSTLCGCINTTIDNFYSIAPYKILGLVTPTPWAVVPPDNANGISYVNAILNIAKLRGIPVLDLFHESGIRPWSGADYIAHYYTEDGATDIGAHPNSLGHKIFLAPHFREFLKKLYY